MLTPEYIEGIGSEYMELTYIYENSVVEDIARKIVKTGILTDSAQWQSIQAQYSGMLMDDIIEKVASYTKFSQEEVRQIFEDAGAECIQIE